MRIKYEKMIWFLRWFYCLQLIYNTDHMPQKNSLWLVMTLALLLIPSVHAVAGTLSPNSNIVHMIAYSGGANSFAKVTLVPDSSTEVGSLLMFVKSSPGGINTSDTNFTTYQHQSPTLNTYYDLEHANVGASQVVQLNLGSSSRTLHITVHNFQATKSISYTVTAIQSPSSDTTQCKSGNPVTPNELYCQSCANTRYIGAYCAIVDDSITKDITYLVQLKQYTDPSNYVAFTIPGSTNKITLYYSTTSANIVNFIQFKEKSDQYAGWMNYVVSGGKNQINKSNTQYTVKISSEGKDIAVSFWNSNNNQVLVTLWYTEQTSSNLLLIILAVLGGILFIMLVIVAVYIVRKMNSNDMRQVAPHSPLRQTNRRSSQPDNTLNAQQINTYFPQVLCRNVFQHHEDSSNNLMQQKQKIEEPDRDCVICLCPVEDKDMMRVTYCRHMFHSQCLVKWFQKNRNCPYCREEFNKKSTVEKYQNLLKYSNKNHLMGVDLVAQLVHSKPMKSSLVVEEIKD